MSWFSSIFQKPKQRRHNQDKLSEEEVLDINRKEVQQLFSHFELKSWEDHNMDKECNERHGCVGLDNLGNTCFMNSALQCMSNTKELTRYILSNKWMNHINGVNTIGSQGSALCAYGQLMRKMWISNKEGNSVNPKNFKKIFSKESQQVPHIQFEK